MSSTRRKNIIWKIEKCTKQNALTVERTAKFLLSLHKVSQLDAKIVLERTSHNEAASAADEMAETETSAAIIVNSEMTDQEKCIKQLALIVERIAKCHSNHQAISR